MNQNQSHYELHIYWGWQILDHLTDTALDTRREEIKCNVQIKILLCLEAHMFECLCGSAGRIDMKVVFTDKGDFHSSNLIQHMFSFL